MVFSPRSLAYSISQRMASATRRSWRTSTGTWYVAPPTRRLFTSRTGFTLSRAFLKVFSGSSLVRCCTRSSARYATRSATAFSPLRIMSLMNLARRRSWNFGSGRILRLAASRRRVRLLGCGGVDAGAYPALLRAAGHRGRLPLVDDLLAAFADELADRRHRSFQNDAAHRDCRRRQEKQGLVPEKRRASY